MLLLLAACTADPADDRPPDGTGVPGTGDTATAPTPTDSGPLDEVDALAAAGFVVREGDFVFSDLSGCCDPNAQCWGNNPSTPYGTPLLPLAPNQAVEAANDTLASFGPVPLGLARTFHLRADEAIVAFGRMPPPARYFSWRSYLAERPGLGHAIVGSLGASLNHLVIAADQGDPAVWDEPFAIVTTLDAGIERRVREALVAAGWDPARIHADRITGEVVRPGLGGEADTFFVLVRTGVWDDAAAGEVYRADPDLRVLRVTPDADEVWSEPWPWPDLPERGTGVTEDPALLEARDALLDAVTATFAGRPWLALVPVPYWSETLSCVAKELNCAGDIRDRFAAITPGFTLGPDEVVVALGPNHERAGKAVYSSAAVQTIESQRGIVALESPAMPGSARSFLPDHPLADELYAWVIARECEGLPSPCVEVPYTCPGVPAEEELKITVRAYLEPATGAAPLPEELVGDVVVKLFAPR